MQRQLALRSCQFSYQQALSFQIRTTAKDAKKLQCCFGVFENPLGLITIDRYFPETRSGCTKGQHPLSTSLESRLLQVPDPVPHVIHRCAPARLVPHFQAPAPLSDQTCFRELSGLGVVGGAPDQTSMLSAVSKVPRYLAAGRLSSPGTTHPSPQVLLREPSALWTWLHVMTSTVPTTLLAPSFNLTTTTLCCRARLIHDEPRLGLHLAVNVD